MPNTTAILMAIAEFDRIRDEEGEDAAIEWAEQMALDIDPPEPTPLKLVE